MISQAGLAYSENPFDLERYRKLQNLATEILAAHSDLNYSVIHTLLESEVGYTTPKIDVRGMIILEGQVLLVQEKLDGNRWTLPGGWADVNESPSEAVAREVYEETGYSCRASRLLAVYDRNKHPHPPTLWHTYKLFFLCEITGGEPKSSLETGITACFAPDMLPELSVARVTYSQIDRLLYLASQPQMPTDFD